MSRTLMAKCALRAITGFRECSSSHIRTAKYDARLKAAIHICQGEYDIILEMAFSLDKLFRSLADPTRLRILNLVADQEICVCFFVDVFGEGQPKISRHLA